MTARDAPTASTAADRFHPCCDRPAGSLHSATFYPSRVIQSVQSQTHGLPMISTIVALLSSVGMILFVLVVLRPFIYEAFVSPTNAMAP